MQAGDRQVFEAMARENADMLRAFLLAIVRDSDLADELFHESFLTAWKKFDTYDPERPFGAYLREIAGKQAVAQKGKVPSKKLLYFDRDTVALLEVQFARADRAPGKWEGKIEALNQCLEILPKPSLDAVSLYYQRDHTCKEIADRLGVDLGAVKRRLQQSRTLLLDCIRSKLAESGEGGAS